jgi:hypothetical protein
MKLPGQFHKKTSQGGAPGEVWLFANSCVGLESHSPPARTATLPRLFLPGLELLFIYGLDAAVHILYPLNTVLLTIFRSMEYLNPKVNPIYRWFEIRSGVVFLWTLTQYISK